MMFICTSLMMKTWHFAFPELVVFLGKLHAVICVDKALAIAVQSCVSHCSKIDKELVVRQILGKIHVGSAIAFLPKELTYLIPHVDALDALVVQPVWGTVYSDIHFSNVWIEIVFRVPGTCCVGHHE